MPGASKILRPLTRCVCWIFAASLLSSCIFMPRTDTVYDDGCQVHFRKMRLDSAELGQLQPRCMNAECVGVLLVGGAITAASAVIAGSIVIVGNTIYWLEKQGCCSDLSRPEAALAGARHE
jgi:hypothetical protein